ncbi:MAG TPA: aspartate--tRNA(Asn) ligase [Conexivisphaerales archaeon]|nr:aspartate--tRNA(Asn) ligase [Conexivisphaerales archaeon]
MRTKEASYSRSHTAAEALKAPAGTVVELLGWVSVSNQVGGLVFIRLRDGSGYIQLAARKGSAPEEAWKEAHDATVESAVYAKGVVKDDPRAPGGKEVSIRDFRVISPSAQWPITRSAIRSPTALYDMRHLAIRGPKTSAVLRIRSKVVDLTMQYFFQRGYSLIQPPILVKAAVEGGSTLFPVKYFGETAYLSQSAQLYEEAAICAFEKVFILQPAFRAEKSKTSRHLTEFWMIEAEIAFAGLPELMKVEEELVRAIATGVKEGCGPELATLGKTVKVPDSPFPKITYDEALSIAAKKGVSMEWGEDLGTEAERLISLEFEQPVFVTGYPVKARSFYHVSDPKRPEATMSADLLAPGGYGEIATGGQRIHEYDVLYRKVQDFGIDPASMTWYLELRKYGLPPHSGFGMGVERVMRWMLGLKHIRSTSIFPRTMNRLFP